MILEVTVTVKAEEENNKKIILQEILKECRKKLSPKDLDFLKKNPLTNDSYLLIKKSIDARHGQIKLHLRYKVFIGQPVDMQINKSDCLPVWKKADENKRVIIIGSGPAGLFAALRLLEDGITPIILERGKKTSERRQDIAKISTKDLVDANSNYCFGEGGAGTFSDGKLYTRSNKRGNINSVLQIFAHFGADSRILTDAHPHIGTDKLPKIINNMRNKIIELGGQVHFNSLFTDLICFDCDGKKIVKGVKYRELTSGQEKEVFADYVILATGHSAPDVYELIAKISPLSLEAKTFAAGVRVEHPREIIDSIQFHGRGDSKLGAAEYRVTCQIDGRGLYSFCMCPGGFVVPSSSGPDEIVVNGMSAAARNSKWSNAAIVVEIRPEDIPLEFYDKAKKMGCPALAGLLFRNYLEKLTKENGDGQAAPAQKLVDFLANKKSTEFPGTSYTPGLYSSNLNDWLPEHIRSRLHKGFVEIDKSMKGFICPQALMIASETRTSTPVRICRDKESLQCTGLCNLYPSGEGAGYSGGIVSSAMDGINISSKIAEKFINF